MHNTPEAIAVLMMAAWILAAIIYAASGSGKHRASNHRPRLTRPGSHKGRRAITPETGKEIHP